MPAFEIPAPSPLCTCSHTKNRHRGGEWLDDEIPNSREGWWL